MKKLALLFVLIFTLIAFTEMFSQGIPETVNYQGVLKDALGNIVPDGNYNITFRLYDLSSTVVWMESKVVSIADGMINTRLGSVVPMSYSIFNGPLWLGVTIESGSELSPRVALTSVPYSFMAMNVADAMVVKSLNGLKDNVSLIAGSNITITPSGNNLTISATGGGGGTVTQVNTGAGLTGGPITTTGTISVANGGITTVMLGDNSVTSAKIVDATITAADIGSAQVVKSLNSIKDNVNLVAGSNITITPSGQNITIASTSGGVGGSGTVNYLPYFSASTTLGNSILYQTSNRLGINTTSPDYSLSINSTTAAGLGLKIFRDGGVRLLLSHSNTNNEGWALNEADVYLRIDKINTSGAVDFSALTFTQNRNVGIGTTNPSYPLHVSTNRRYAGYFTTDSLSGIAHAVHGEIIGTGTGYDPIGVYGKSVPADYYGLGGYFVGGYVGVTGRVLPTGNSIYFGLIAEAVGGGGTNYAVRGYASGTGFKYGARCFAEGTGTNYGIYSSVSGGTTNWAGYFSGNVNVTGTLSKGGGSFKIDHPLDPQNKYLYHSFVESPDMMNIYNGNIVTDGSGYATVNLPDWFEALNKEFRYQLTVIGDFAQAIIAQEVQGNQFAIRTDKPNVKVSWQVTGIRKDAFAEKNRIPVEELKQGDDAGKYIHPDAFGLPETMGIDYEKNNPEKLREVQ
ncbi:MAG TPA: hypothetical protein VLH59_04190 [Ignavibacteriaceae bacterium]|nr:hypothetical protein [Ignavibacteriaceae bacterium]